MDFFITKEQQSMQKSAREFLKARCTPEYVREMEENEKGYHPDFWKKMAELDWMALIIPEEYDGLGSNFFDLVLMMEEMGRFCLPGPFFSTVVLGAMSVMLYGTEEQRRRILPAIGTAKLIMTLALTEPETTRYAPDVISVTAEKKGDHYVINGTKLFVSDAHVADIMVCAARTSGAKNEPKGITLFLIDAKLPGIRISPLITLGGDKQFEVGFQNFEAPADAVLGGVNEGSAQLNRILQYAVLCKCAEMVGGAEKVLEMAAAYAKERKQFGKPIGAFQAIQHHCANMLIDLEGSRYITYKAAWMLGNHISCEKEISIAKAWVSDAYQKITSLGHQVQGGAAFMKEHDMQLFSRRSMSAAVAFGDAAFHRNKVATALGL
ncbi:acyl-CoA dehydrogenase family protein [Desulfatirhabdium butyrativorans]|uniref:acyl-CoA dehydrogenase family protein n=1 Tax=Desulfatirhabdium butyrativorans TaxID=340467 RepID=UPI000413B796|nr:acyl-CoA dehydrogenase family protein [Desulfatirhabdium butyrativorans]